MQFHVSAISKKERQSVYLSGIVIDIRREHAQDWPGLATSLGGLGLAKASP
jgi:hypothetical protein